MIITSLFLVFSSFAVWGSTVYFWIGTHFMLQTEAYGELQTEELISPHVAVGLAEILGILAGLKFMWDIRVASSNSRRKD